jgi:hypothetical protein
MGLFNTIRMGSSAAGDYEVEQSLRFDDDQSSPSRLQRTIQSGGNKNKWTLSVWVKRSQLGNPDYSNSLGGNDGQQILHAAGAGNRGLIKFKTDDTLSFEQGTDGGYSAGRITTTAVFRDTSAWYHLCFVADYANSTTADRAKIFVNGVQQEVTTNVTFLDGSASDDCIINRDRIHEIGFAEYAQGYTGSSNWFNFFCGYMAEFYFIDGQAYDPTYFTKTNPVTGQLIPKKYSGSFGTTGWYLDFLDNSAVTATTLGKDSSGNSNNWTPNGFSVSAGTGNDSLEDTPTNNFCTLNPLDKSNGASLREGNLTLYTDSNDQAATGTFGITSGKWYWEVDKNATEPEIGIAHFQMPLSAKGTSVPSDGQIAFIVSGADSNTNFLRVNGSTTTGTGMSAQTGTGSIGIALDMDNKKIWWSDLSGNYFNSGNPATGANAQVDFSSTGEYPNGVTPFVSIYQGSGNTTSINFGQRPFSYSAPTGFKTLCSANLPDPTILLPNKHFDTLEITGNQSTNAITGLDFQPDWVVYKALNPETGNGETFLHDSVRGSTVRQGIKPYNSTTPSAEVTNSSYLVSFNSNGLTVGSDGVYNTYHQYNQTGRLYQALCWDAGETDGKTYTVTVVDDSGNKFRFDGFGTSAVTLDLAEGGTYIFNYPAGHPFRFSTTADGTHGGGSEYTTGVTHNSSTQVTIVVAASAPNLNYYCSSHSGMGGAINTNSTLGSSNFDGSTQSRVKVNATAGFSLVSYTGTGSLATVGHGLGVKPDVMIIKNRNSEGHGFLVYHTKIGATKNLQLQTNSPEATASNKFNDTEPTSTVFTVNTSADGNQSSQNFISYIFSEVSGYSKFGSYIGNANAEGTYVFCGFEPSFLLIKRSSSGDNSPWIGYNNKRNPFNQVDNQMVWNTTEWENIDANNCNLDFVSNGFKLRNSEGSFNSSGGIYIFLAFAHAPFKNARAR